MLPTIAFIDDGIAPSAVPPGIPFETYTVQGGTVLEASPKTPLPGSHATICYGIFHGHLRSLYPSTSGREPPYRLISVQVLDCHTGTGNIKDALAALKWCASREDINIIHMSMGTRQYQDFVPISNAAERLKDKIIIAACSNQNTITIPACLPGVIAVRHCEHEALNGGFAYITGPFDQVDICVCAAHEIKSNSTAAPLITARVCSYMSRGAGMLSAVRQNLKKNSVKDISFIDYEFNKQLFPEWEEVNVPVVCFPHSIPGSPDTLMKLIRYFHGHGYRAAALSVVMPADVCVPVLRLPAKGSGGTVLRGGALQNAVRLGYNFLRPDILFLHMGGEDARALPDDIKTDLVIGTDISSTDGVEVVFDRIEKWFGTQ